MLGNLFSNNECRKNPVKQNLLIVNSSPLRYHFTLKIVNFVDGKYSCDIICVLVL